jgi:hypothetical protein
MVKITREKVQGLGELLFHLGPPERLPDVSSLDPADYMPVGGHIPLNEYVMPFQIYEKYSKDWPAFGLPRGLQRFDIISMRTVYPGVCNAMVLLIDLKKDQHLAPANVRLHWDPSEPLALLPLAFTFPFPFKSHANS